MMRPKTPCYLRPVLYVSIGAVFVGCAFFMFKWGHPIKLFGNDYVIDKDLFSAFGDFVGGVLGTFFSFASIVLLLVTFKYQRKVTNKQQKMASDLYKQTERQRFHDLFFELLKLYQTQVNDLEVNGKDFFEEEKKNLQAKYSHKASFEDNRKRAVNYYMLFYVEHHTKLGAYFRTLYRIYDLIDKAGIGEKEKKDYLKIIRAQLTESELFFIRYNAMTIYGSKFIGYINKYNILKHLPAFELLEFKDWWNNLLGIERMGINILYMVLYYKTRKHLAGNADNDEIVDLSDNGGKYNFSIHFVKDYDVQIVLRIDNGKKNRFNEYLALKKFDSKKIQQMLDCFIKEIFVYSNFGMFNGNASLLPYSDKPKTDGNIVTINSGIKNINNQTLFVRKR